ncbi:palmitoyltransferase ZDHHC3 [Harmonia axyridis]|uniref:palmitoyltransferase ZDHHC3 n=1 Tax=Harmonia axyridis TaxID=115357 RepID=UPI001E275C6E|nr:palmitoyltransferase ZDHHC3 [Harmonia axyridis]
MLVKDPCGIACIIITYSAIFYADYVVVKWIILQTMVNSLWGAFNLLTFNAIIFLLCMSHIRAVLTDPGTIPLPENRMDFSDLHSNASLGCDLVNWTICTRCETYRPPRAHHCRICKRCILRMDHHCPWINNCVGERNQKFFLQFLIYVGALAGYSVILVVISWLTECSTCSNDIIIKQSRIMHSVILMLESTLFGMFVMAIFIDQMQAILGDETAVEQITHQGPYRPFKSKMALLTEVCGKEHPLLWLLPCSSVHKRYEENLLNYEV